MTRFTLAVSPVTTADLLHAKEVLESNNVEPTDAASVDVLNRAAGRRLGRSSTMNLVMHPDTYSAILGAHRKGWWLRLPRRDKAALRRRGLQGGRHVRTLP